MKRKRRETNEEFIVRIMNFGCPTGALIQAFIMEALARYCVEVQKASFPDTPLLSGEAWKATGAWLQSQLDEHFNGN